MSTSVQAHSTHVRRTSAGVNALSLGMIPYVTSLIYDERTGQISLPMTPPFSPTSPRWGEKSFANQQAAHYHGRGLGFDRRPTFRLLRGTVLSGTICVLILMASALSYFSHSSASSSAITNALGTTKLLSRLTFGSGSIKEHCDPYSQPGHLIADGSDADANNWIPNDTRCIAKRFLRELRSQRSSVDMRWLMGKTALVIGDSVSREQVEAFCNFMGEEIEIIRPSHQYSPGTPRSRGSPSASPPNSPKRLSARRIGGTKDAALPMICHVKKYDLLVASVSHFGLDQEDYWRESNMAQYSSPGSVEDRLTDVITPLIVNLRNAGRASAPDFVEVSTGTWDLAKFAREDQAATRSTLEELTPDRVSWYTSRVGQMFSAVQDAFPNAKVKTWRTPHQPIDQLAEHNYFMNKISYQNKAAPSAAEAFTPLFALNRVYQLDQAVRSLLLPTVSSIDPLTSLPASHGDWRINEFGTILKGHETHRKDRLHGDALSANYIWAEIFLYELWRGSTK